MEIKSRKGLTVTLLTVLFINFGQSALADGHQIIKVALLPIIDTLPFYVAQERGFFKEQGVKAEAIPVASGLERDQLMQAGVIDGMLNEMMTTANFNRNKSTVKVVMISRAARNKHPMFRLLAGKNSNINAVKDLAGKSIGISKNTIIEYVTDRLLEANGLNPNQVVKVSIPAIPERFQLLMQNQVPAVVLPDPLAKAAIAAGAKLVIDDSDNPKFSVSVLSFSVQSMNTSPQKIRGFLKAWDRAAAEINRAPESFRNIMLKRIRVPGNVKNTYAIPYFPRREVPDEKQWQDVMSWMTNKGLLKSPLPYTGSITKEFLP
jgi:NitT/TauT family transport system substrate-binding protein